LSWYSPKPKQKPKRLPRRRPIKAIPSGIGDEGIVGNWLFYYLKGGDHLHDFSGKGNHGTINGPVWKDGSYGWALDFDGNDDYVKVLNSASLKNVGYVTASMWINLDNLNDQNFYTHKNGDDGHEIVIFNGDLGLWVKIAGTWYSANVVASDYLTTDTWYHLVGTYDGLTIRLYVDGSEVSSNTIDQGPIPAIDADLCIGQNQFTGGAFVDGTIDEFRIYNRALSSSEIQAIYNRTKGVFGL